MFPIDQKNATVKKFESFEVEYKKDCLDYLKSTATVKKCSNLDCFDS